MLPIVTIASKNYLAQVRVLAESYLEFHPDGQVFVCLVDTVDHCFDPSNEPFTLIQADQLSIPLWEHFSFKYNILELNTAVKPFLLRYLFAHYDLNKIAYFDPDIVLYQPLDTLDTLLDEHGIVLTPHILDPIDDLNYPSEMDLLLSGMYNLGFLGVSKHTDLEKLFGWWQRRLYDYCLRDVERGLFVDQRWMDFAPALFPNVYIWRDEGCNVAYWNLMHRPIELHGEQYSVKQVPLRFVHYSGLVVENLAEVSKHQDRYTLSDLPSATQGLIIDYQNRLLRHDYAATTTWPYAYGTYDNNAPISDLDRTICRELDPNANRWSNPFKTGPGSFYRFLHRASRDNIHLFQRRAFSWTRRVAAVTLPPLLGEKQYQRVRQFVFRQPSLQVERRQEVHVRPGTLGVNIIGYLRSETGVGEAARGTIRALHAVNYPMAYSDVTLNDIARKDDYTVDRLAAARGVIYPINLMHVNADQVPFVQQELGKQSFDRRYNIGFWFWELAQFPSIWQDRFALLDEIWVASSWCQRTISSMSPKPVLTMPLYVAPQTLPHPDRAHFGLRQDKFIVLSIFDALSSSERKNPFAVIRAFTKAFGDIPNAQLVMKVSHLERSASGEKLNQTLLDAMKSVGGILIDQVMTRQETNSILSLCDTYVSLHRSEGFGLTMAEAMYLGKPVIATGYSSNMDFMTSRNSYPVDYELVPIEETVGPYEKGFMWAEPDEDHAAFLMRQVYQTADHELTARASADIRLNYGLNTVQQALQSRLNFISHWIQAK